MAEVELPTELSSLEEVIAYWEGQARKAGSLRKFMREIEDLEVPIKRKNSSSLAIPRWTTQPDFARRLVMDKEHYHPGILRIGLAVAETIPGRRRAGSPVLVEVPYLLLSTPEQLRASQSIQTLTGEELSPRLSQSAVAVGLREVQLNIFTPDQVAHMRELLRS